MNKITTNSQCECNVNNDTALRLVAGNDFTMRLRLTKKDGELIVPYDLTDAQDLTVNAFGHSGDIIELDSFIEDSSHVIVSIDADEFESYIPYSIEIKWYDEPYYRRSCAANLFMFVTTQQEANEVQDTIVAGPYDYQIEITNDVAYVIVGAMPSTDGAVTEEELEETLENYVTNSSLSTTLNDYVTDNQLSSTLQSYIDETELSSTLSSYVTYNQLSSTLQLYATTQYVDDAINNVDLTDYYNKTEIDTTLQSYATISYVNEAISNIPGTDLSNYYTKSDIDTTLTSYVTDNQLSSTLQSYVTESELNTALNSYIDETELSTTLSSYVSNNQLSSTLESYITDSELNNTLQSYIDETELSSTLSSYATIAYVNEAIANIPGGGSGDVTMTYLDNYLEATAYALTQHELDLYTLNRNFSNYYDKTTSDSRYLSSSQASSNYVSILTNENQNQATAYALNDLDDRVTYIEQNGSGGGGGYVPTVNDATLTIQRNGTTLSYFTANAYSDVTCNITVPTDTNDLTNGANFVSSSYINEIVQISQNDYDALVSGGTVDSYTMYVIV